MGKYRKYVIYSPAIGLIIGAIAGLIFAIVASHQISGDVLYGAVIGACAGWGFRSDYNKKHKNNKE